MSDPLNENLVKALADIMIFLESADEDEMDPDLAVKCMETVGFELTLMSIPEQLALGDAFRRIATTYDDPDEREIVEGQPEGFGLGENEPNDEERDQRGPTLVGPFNDYLVSALAAALIFIEFSESEWMQDDAALTVLSRAAANIKKMSKEEQVALGKQFESVAQSYAHLPHAQQYLRALPGAMRGKRAIAGTA